MCGEHSPQHIAHNTLLLMLIILVSTVHTSPTVQCMYSGACLQSVNSVMSEKHPIFLLVE